MASLGTIGKLGAAALALYLFYSAGGASGIGNRIGGGVSSFTSGIAAGFGSAGATLGDLFGSLPGLPSLDQAAGQAASIVPARGNIPEEQTASVGSIIDQLGLRQQVTEGSYNPQAAITQRQRGLLELAGTLQAGGLPGKIDLTRETISSKNQGVQDLSFAIDQQTGMIKTGTSGLGPGTIEAQRRLAQQYGIVTFDVHGNISNVGPYAAGHKQ